MNKHAFIHEAAKLYDNKVVVEIDSQVQWLNGYLVFLSGRAGIVNGEFDGVHILPEFIKNEQDATHYVSDMGRAFIKGFSDGSRSKQNEVAKVLGLVRRPEV